MLSLCSGLATSILDDYTYNKQQKMKNDHPGSDGYILLDDDLLDLFYNNNEAANRALDAPAKTHMLKQQYEREQTKAIEKVKRLHEMEMLELRQKLDDALMLVRQLSHSPRNSVIKQLNSDEKNTHVIKKNLDKSNDVSNLSDNTEEINISLKDVVVDVQV